MNDLKDAAYVLRGASRTRHAYARAFFFALFFVYIVAVFKFLWDANWIWAGASVAAVFFCGFAEDMMRERLDARVAMTPNEKRWESFRRARS